jgi:hypothetical protein
MGEFLGNAFRKAYQKAYKIDKNFEKSSKNPQTVI